MKKIFDSLDLGSGMTFKTHPGIGFTHAAAIINHLDQRFAGIIDNKFDFCGTCIYGIFQQVPLQHWPVAGSLHRLRSGWQYYQVVVQFYRAQFISPAPKISDLSHHNCLFVYLGFLSSPHEKIIVLFYILHFFYHFPGPVEKPACPVQTASLSENNWVDSVFNSLNNDEKIAQLIVIRAHSNLGPDHVAKVTDDIQKYNVGALCFFQGGPVRQANLTNYYQSIAKTPLMITIDGEWGLGMRLDSVTKFPYQLTLGALNDDALIYEMGMAVGEQCKRIGVHVNYAPVVDINNNPNNPVIGYRSFGEDKDKVIKFGVAYMKGMQDAGIMACAKHFPGHGDVDVDSHLDLPVINKSIAQLDSLELIPFRAMFNAGVGSVMIAHLYIPAIDSTANRATSISKNNVTGLLRNDMGYNGLTFTDALEMKGVAKYFPGGEIAVEALIAGNDMLCLPESVPDAIDAVEKAIEGKKLSWDDINAKVKKVLHAKYHLGLNKWKPVDTTNLVNDLNARTDEIRYRVARQTITIVKNKVANYIASPKIACVSHRSTFAGFFCKYFA